MKVNIRQLIKSDRPVIGSWINSASPIIAELMASTGFDFLTVDVEHSAVDLVQTQMLFQAIKSGNPQCAPLVRLAGNSYADTKRYLDAGASGVIAPFINRADQARELIRADKYPPEGMRGVGFCRANGYGMRLRESVASANDETFVCVQIEHIEAVSNIDDILCVPGIDAIIIGPYDLSASMGLTAQFEHPEMVKVINSIGDACRRHSVVAGIHVVQPDTAEVTRRYREGYSFIAYSLDITMLMNACMAGLAEIRNNLA